MKRKIYNIGFHVGILMFFIAATCLDSKCYIAAASICLAGLLLTLLTGIKLGIIERR